MKDCLDIKTTKIGKRYHALLIHDELGIIDEMACRDRKDIGFICAEMLKWADKLGYVSALANASRKRMKNYHHIDKIWYKKDLHKSQAIV